jgi:predicted transcriptional regulator
MTATTMTMNLSEREMAVLDAMAADKDMSKTQIMRQALRLYQLVDERIKAGEKMMFSGDQQRIIEFVGL